jgi:starch-binding outer membrane protein, SusD/RagB family
MEIPMRRIMRKTATLGAVLLFGLTACADLDVVNPNAPDAELALANPGDIVSLITGAYQQWWLSVHHFSGPSHVISNMSFQQSSWPANFGMVDYSRLPRQHIVNVGLHMHYANVVDGVWSQAYTCLAAVAQGLRSLEDPAISGELSAGDLTRVRAFGKFMQGLCHGSLALFYEGGFILDETNVDGTRDPATGAAVQQPEVTYTELLNASLEYFDEAIALSEDETWTLPTSWMSVQVPAAELAQLASTMKARYRANAARTPAERQAVDWDAVLEDLDNGLESWNMEYPQSFVATASGYWNDLLGRSTLSWIGWNQASYMIYGMADQSGNYQEWLSVTPAETRHPNLPSGNEFLIVTPDQRFAQGATREEQQTGQTVNTLIQFNGGPPDENVGPNSWGQPARGTHRWSFYRNSIGDGHIFDGVTSIPEVTTHETRLLRAEAHYWNGNLLDAATLINVTRVGEGGLSAANPLLPDDGNASCVPRLPDESCGDLLEMLKWEKRLHTAFLGVHANTWYFDGRGWGDLYAGTPLHLPVPCDENDLWGLPCTNVGGVGGPDAAPVSVYGWPGEG